MRWKGAIASHRWAPSGEKLLIHSGSPSATPGKTSHSPFRWPSPARGRHGKIKKRKKRKKEKCQSSPLLYTMSSEENSTALLPWLCSLYSVSHFLFPFLGHKPSLQLVWFTQPGGPAIITSQRSWLPLREGSEDTTWKDKISVHS